ncbi:OTU protein [Ophidiomyces ophidiicola]|nr:OTU protein [Ophidiomyces ophidiicola]
MSSRTEMEDIQAKHRKEQRDLQSRITQKKKSATKKTRKGVNDECERWQRELLERQQAEIEQLNGEANPPTNELDALHIIENGDAPEMTNEPADAEPKATPPPHSIGTSPLPATTATASSAPSFSESQPKKANRQKARLARRAAEREAEVAAAETEAANQTDYRGNEKQTMLAAFKRLGLAEREIAPDGHCLYSAVATQLPEIGLGLRLGETAPGPSAEKATKGGGYKEVRAVTGRYVLGNANDFAPFIEEPVEEYARKIMFTAEWGGQLELQAMARAYGVEINVIQGDGRIEKFEGGDIADGEERKKIWLAYYRHSYGLGEHYNALTEAAR